MSDLKDRVLKFKMLELPGQLDYQVLRIHKELDAQMTQIQSRKQELLAIGHEVTE